MGKYSDIDSIHIKNFKSLGDIGVSFGKNRILALRGLGESGKSSVIKATSSCLSTKDETKLKRYIRKGTKGFSVGITLEDGTLIQRIKSDVDNSLTIKGKDIDYKTTKITRGGQVIEELYKVAGISNEVETKEYLHFRSYSDLLLFVDSSGGTNFKVIRDVLNLEELTHAIKNGNKNCKDKKNDVSNNIKLKSELVSELESIKTVELDSLSNLKGRINKNKELLNELKAIKDLVTKVEYSKEKLSSFDNSGYEKLKHLQTTLNNFSKHYSTLKELKRLNTNLGNTKIALDKYKLLKDIKQVDVTLITRLYNLNGMNKIVIDLKDKGKTLRLYKTLDSLKKINTSNLVYLKDLQEKHSSILSNDKQLNTIKEELNSMEKTIKESGYQYCKNCLTIYK